MTRLMYRSTTMSGKRDLPIGRVLICTKGEQVLSQVTSFVSYFRARLSSDEGATMVEYGIMVALIAVVSVLVVGALGVDVFNAFDTAQDKISTGSGPKTPS